MSLTLGLFNLHLLPGRLWLGHQLHQFCVESLCTSSLDGPKDLCLEGTVVRLSDTVSCSFGHFFVFVDVGRIICQLELLSDEDKFNPDKTDMVRAQKSKERHFSIHYVEVDYWQVTMNT